MKKFMFAAAALAIAVLGFGGLQKASTTYASPVTVYTINGSVMDAIVTCPTVPNDGTNVNTGSTTATISATNATHYCNPRSQSDRATIIPQLATIEAASGQQISQAAQPTGVCQSGAQVNPCAIWVMVLTNGSRTPITLNVQGAQCTANGFVTFASATGAEDATGVCDGLTPITPVGAPLTASTPWDNFMVFEINPAAAPAGGSGSLAVGTVITPTAVQDAVSVAGKTDTIVGAPHDMQLTTLNNVTTVSAGATACAIGQTATAAAPAATLATALATYTDINGNALVGNFPTFSSSSSGVLAIGSSSVFPQGSNTNLTLVNADGKIGAENAICGDTAGSVTLTATTVAGEIAGVTGAVSRTATITVGGVPASIALTASPATIACDGTATSSVTAKVTDSSGANVADGTSVNFSVVALGTANPINVATKAGSASTTVTPLSGSTAGVTVIVTSGSAQASIRVDCTQPTPVPPPAPAPTAVGGTGTIVGPNTGTGGYLGQNGAAGFPMWTLVALALGSLVLVGSGMVTRRSGK